MSLASLAQNCCSNLASVPGLSVYTPGTPSYNATETSFWSLTETRLAPQCIVVPQSTEDVSRIVASLVRDDCKFAIKSQGHAPAAGFANIQGGVTIDMTSMDQVSLDHASNVASVGTGASWLDVYKYLDDYNRTVAGGRNGAVGVGGLSLGGGISYFSPQVGFTCDTAVNFEVVLASGKIVNANRSSRADLYRALKGGLNNFGVVTRIDFAAVDYDGLLGGSLIYDIGNHHDVFAAFSDIAGAPYYDVHASIVVGLLFNGTAKSWTLLSTPIYTLPVSRPAVYEPLFAVPNISDSLSIVKLGTFANETPTPVVNWLFQTITFGVSATLLDSLFAKVNETLSCFDPPGSTLWSLAIEPLPTVFVSRGQGQNSLGTSAADGNSVILLISAFWIDESAGEIMQAKAREIEEQIRGLARSMRLEKEFLYANYAGPRQHVFHSYGEENFKELKAVGKKYDPRGVFQKLVPGGFKL